MRIEESNCEKLVSKLRIGESHYMNQISKISNNSQK